MRESSRPFLTADDLPEIRENTDWPQLLKALGIECDPGRSKPGDTWAHSPFTPDKKASFHLVGRHDKLTPWRHEN